MYDLLKCAYKMFKLFKGNFMDIPPDEIYNKCEQFFTPVSTYVYFINITNKPIYICQPS